MSRNCNKINFTNQILQIKLSLAILLPVRDYTAMATKAKNSGDRAILASCARHVE